ncbi:MAG: GatB/YqeY domain-containing protein [Bacilli bacterium]
MRDRILNDLKTAMKNQDKDTLKVIRMVKGSMQLAEIDLKHELNDDEVINIISKEIKTRRDSIKEFEKGNRQDLVEETLKEINVLEKYLPEQLSEDEVNLIIDDVFNKVQPSGMQEMGKIMGMISPLVKGKADLGTVSSKIREKLSNL